MKNYLHEIINFKTQIQGLIFRLKNDGIGKTGQLNFRLLFQRKVKTPHCNCWTENFSLD